LFTSTDKAVRYKTGLICSRSTNELLKENVLRKTKTTRENSSSQVPSSGIIVLQSNYSKSTPIVKKGRIEINCSYLFKPGKYSQASICAPSVEKSNPSAG
jgi:hypothetical protein